MAYAYSQLDKDNLMWFANNKGRQTLSQVRIENGNIRGVFPCQIDFRYPITAFVGENGSGKSTLLALSACAYHNDDSFHQFGRKKSYFTFGDFFTFSRDEAGLGGIRISYNIRKQEGDVPEARWKKPSGKWNDFHTRTKRNVVYLGINRIVPPSESSVHRSYRRLFERNVIEGGLRQQLIDTVGKVFGKNYADLEILGYNNYRLYLVRRDGLNYSGFNMGAGENAVFSILFELLNAGKGALLIIDEIELGLHAKAQKIFIDELKSICRTNECQIICSSHSNIILDALPPEGRFFIQSKPSETVIIPEISSQYAFGKLMGQNTEELNVFVEDEVGQAFLMNILPLVKRERVKIFPIGSDQAILRQMASYYREGKLNFISFLDGDKHTKQDEEIRQIKRYLEDRIEDQQDVFENFMRSRLCYLPGSSWPEKYIIEQLMRLESKEDLCEIWDVDNDHDVTGFLEQALSAGKHNEFYSLSQNVYRSEESTRNDCIHCYKKHYRAICDELGHGIELILQQL